MSQSFIKQKQPSLLDQTAIPLDFGALPVNVKVHNLHSSAQAMEGSMGITINKKKVTAEPVEKDKITLPEFLSASDMEISELVDAYANVKAKIDELSAPIAPLNKVLGEYKTALQTYVDSTSEANEKKTLAGETAFLEFGEKAKVRTLSEDAIEKFIEFVGAETALKILKIGLGDCDKYLTLQQRAEIITEEQAGHRSMKLIPKE